MPRASLLLLVIATAPWASAREPGDAPAMVEFRLPFPEKAGYEVSRGNGDEPSHLDEWNRYAFDFWLPEGSPVCACADGTVTGFREASEGPGEDNNFVDIRHADGRVSRYFHLRKDGALVEIGEQVLAGDLIGYSGNTGNSEGPHLHFNTWASDHGPSVPCRFADVPDDGVPKKGQYVRSGNVAVREVPGVRQILDGERIWTLVPALDARAAAIRALEAVPKRVRTVRHASVERLVREWDDLLAARAVAAEAALAEAREAVSAGRTLEAARLAVFGREDWGGLPVVPSFSSLAAKLSQDEAFPSLAKELASARKFRKLVAEAVKAEVAATARGPVHPRAEKDAAPALARPDYASAIDLLTSLAASAPDAGARDAIAAHIEDLRRSR